MLKLKYVKCKYNYIWGTTITTTLSSLNFSLMRSKIRVLSLKETNSYKKDSLGYKIVILLYL